MKKIKVEGFIDDLFDMMKPPELNNNNATKWMDNRLEPHTAMDLYNAVVETLRTKCSDATVKNDIMPLFFPKNSDKKKLSDLTKLDNGKYVDPNLVAHYSDAMESAVVEFATTDAIDIMKQVDQTYLDQDKGNEAITGDVYFGTILQQAIGNQYDLIDNLKSLYDDYKAAADKEENQVDAPMNDKTTNTSSNSNDIVGGLVKAIRSKNSSLSEADIKALLSSEAVQASIAELLSKKR